MTIAQQRKILQRISEVETDITELKRVKQEIASSGFASATMSSGGGSRSYTRADIGKITEAISSLVRELRGLRRMLLSGSSQGPVIETHYIVWG
jgi:hypothetical protein